MQMEAATAQLKAHYESCDAKGWAFDEMFRLCMRLTALPPAMALLFTAGIFPLEFEFYCHRVIGEHRAPHAGRWGVHFDDDNVLWN